MMWMVAGLLAVVVGGVVEAKQAAVPEAQVQAHAQTLAAIAGDESLDSAAVHARAGAVADQLPGWRAAGWLRSLPPDPAEARVRVGQIAAMLAFKPRRESDTPAGWPAYTPVGEIELKQYPAYRAAVSTTERAGMGGMFWQLFRHISSNDIPMTAPVDMTVDTSAGDAKMTSMAFLYQNTEVGKVGPDGSVQVIDYPAMTAVSIGMIGQWRESQLQRAEELLDEWIKTHLSDSHERSGPMRVLGYNGPGVPDSQKYYEIQLPVRAK